MYNTFLCLFLSLNIWSLWKSAFINYNRISVFHLCIKHVDVFLNRVLLFNWALKLSVINQKVLTRTSTIDCYRSPFVVNEQLALP